MRPPAPQKRSTATMSSLASLVLFARCAMCLVEFDRQSRSQRAILRPILTTTDNAASSTFVVLRFQPWTPQICRAAASNRTVVKQMSARSKASWDRYRIDANERFPSEAAEQLSNFCNFIGRENESWQADEYTGQIVFQFIWRAMISAASTSKPDCPQCFLTTTGAGILNRPM